MPSFRAFHNYYVLLDSERLLTKSGILTKFCSWSLVNNGGSTLVSGRLTTVEVGKSVKILSTIWKSDHYQRFLDSVL